ncbi:hypothetical protein [Streptomyces sp. RFCAC02]|uniref:hypothetical protein n=1 Tax=Streptomyces sp. RFCAC02 TaxID=2499143 RepID=UPI0010229EAC|nr:hypothetical protein [Streptomyces sp. RFCAC02]
MVNSPVAGSAARRAAVEASRAEVVTAYLAGESFHSLCIRWGVSNTWLTKQFDAWGIIRRTQAEAFALARNGGPAGAAAMAGRTRDATELEERVRRAVAVAWPGGQVRVSSPLGSLGAHVRRVMVSGDGEWYAKVARGTDDAGVRREAACLRWLSPLEPRVPSACLVDDVLFTRAVTGPSLASRLTAEPERTVELLAVTLAEAGLLARMCGHLPLPLDITRIQTGTGLHTDFLTRFATRPSDTATGPSCGLLDQLHRAVEPLIGGYRPPARRELSHGSLCVEHVRWPAPNTPTLLSPRLRMAPIDDDLAQLLSRTLLTAAVMDPIDMRRSRILHGVDAVINDRERQVRGQGATRRWAGHLLVRCLMDMACHTAACFSAPRPYSPHVRRIIDHALPLIAFFARSTRMARDDGRAWTRMLEHVGAVYL